MITDVEMEALNLLENMCVSKQEQVAVSIISDMLAALDIDAFYQLSTKDKETFIKPYAEKLSTVYQNQIQEKKKKENWLEKTKTPNGWYSIDLNKLEEYVKEEMIMVFENAEESRKFFNQYDGQNFATVEEMKQYQDVYGFGLHDKWYHVSFDEALDVKQPVDTLDKKIEQVEDRQSIMSINSIVFQNPNDMLNYIVSGNDLYNPQVEEYVFVFNENQSICVYPLSIKQAEELSSKTKDDFWSSLLGIGGYIYDEPHNLDWCKDHYHLKGWVNTQDFDKHVEKKEAAIDDFHER